MANEYSTAQIFQAGSTAVAAIAGSLAGTFAIIANPKRSSQLFSTEALTHMRTAAAVLGVVAALALTLALAAVIVDPFSKGTPENGVGGDSILAATTGSINQQP